MPIIFIMSAIVSGIALLVVLYVIVTKIRKAQLDYDCLRSLSLWLMGFLSVNVVIEALEVFTMLYESEESWAIVSQLINQKITLGYYGIQFLLGAIVPLLILGGTEITKLQACA